MFLSVLAFDVSLSVAVPVLVSVFPFVLQSFRVEVIVCLVELILGWLDLIVLFAMVLLLVVMLVVNVRWGAAMVLIVAVRGACLWFGACGVRA